MKIKIFFPLLLIAASILSSCKKSDDPAPSSTTTNPTANGGSYLPMTTGNTWNYHGESFNYTSSSTGNTQTYSGTTYKELKQINSNSTTPSYGYVIQEGNKYYSYGVIGSTPVKLKLIDLDLPFGNTWVTKIASNVYTDVTYTFKVSGTGLIRTVNGIPYSNVISIQLNTTCQLSATGVAFYTQYGFTAAEIQGLQDGLAGSNFVQTTYYSNNIGVIEQTSPTAGLNIQLLSSTIN